MGVGWGEEIKTLTVSPLRLSFLFRSCGLWTLSCDFVSHNYETLKWLSSLPTRYRSHSGGDSVPVGI